MFSIKIERLGPTQLKTLGVFEWDIWEKEVSTFDWRYDEQERCYFVAGKVRVEPADGPAVDIVAGDFVTFPAGMSCTWKVLEPAKKHYKFG
jgi:hypothetical protein